MDDKAQIKAEPVNHHEIPAKSTELLEPPPVPYNEMLPEKNELVICDIKQEPWHLNEVTTDIALQLQEPPISDLEPCMNTVVIKSLDNIKMGIKEEPMWNDTSAAMNGSFTCSQTEGKHGNGEKNEAFEDILPMESPRLSTEVKYPEGNSVTVLDTEKDDALCKAVCVNKASQRASLRTNNSSLNCNPPFDSVHFDSKPNGGDKSMQIYKCEICEKCYSHKSSLKNHKMVHAGTTQYKCEFCNKYFTFKSQFQSHALCHSGLKPYKCDKCQKCFTRKSHLHIHTMFHSGTTPYKCDICDKYFTQRSNLQNHIVLHSGTKPYKCDMCEKCFTQKSHLQTHILIHSGNKPYKCDICEMCFAHKSNLQKHTLLHSGSKPYKCDRCEKCYTRNSHLQTHKLLHSGIKPYKCELCQKSFTQKPHLKRHSLLHSGKNT